MIHIIRKNETIDDIAYIYDVSKEKIINYNPCILNCENSSMWVNCDGIVSFNEITKEKNTYPNFTYQGLKLSVVHKVDSLDGSFVPVDNWARDCNEVFIDGYKTDEHTGELNLPYDYPSINACCINNIVPSFVIKDLEQYMDENVMNMLLTDLSFKEYQNVMIYVSNFSEFITASELCRIFHEEGFGVMLASQYNVLKRVEDFSKYDIAYYSTERNIIDFESFSQNVSDLQNRIGAEKTGVLYTPRYVDINKTTSEIVYLSFEDILNITKTERIEKINFDNDSQLCWFRYTDKYGSVHSVLYEDFRTFYAKAAFLKENRIKNICFNGCNSYTNILGKIFGIVK